jgi:UDP-glucose 4-epimerase
VIAIFCGRLLGGERPIVFGDGLQTRDYVHVDDVVTANLAAAESDVFGGINIGTGIETSVNELYKGLADAAGSKTPASYAAGKPGEQRRSCLDIRRASERLGWTPTADLASGLARTVDYFRN